MPYSAPVTYANPATTVQELIDRAAVRDLLANAEATASQAEASVGVSADAIASVAADGAVELSTETAGAALVDGAVGAGVVGGGTVVAVAGTSLALAEGIRQIPGWDNFARHVGLGILDGVFGLGSHPSLTPEVKLYVADYVQHRFINQRQREATQFNMLHGQILRLSKVQGSLARDVHHLNQATHAARVHAQANAATYTDKRVAAAIAYANARAHNVGVASEKYARDLSASDRRYSHDIAAQAERNANAHTTHVADTLRRDLTAATGVAVAASVAAHLKPITSALAQLRSQVDKLQTENDTCTEPMCETVGPKSDWGKLLKRFAPKAIFALLALLAAEHPDEVAKVSAELGAALGPVLEAAIAGSLIPLGPSPVSQPSQATHALGPFPL